MKVENEDIDRVLDKLIAATHSPRGEYSAENSWKHLQARMRKHRSLRRLWLRVSSAAAAVVVLCLASWAAYYTLSLTAPKSVPVPEETHVAAPAPQARIVLEFRQQPLQEIARELSKTFRTEIRIEDEGLKNYRMTATFQNNENLTQILDLLKNAAGNFTYTKNNQTIVITKKQF